MDIGYRQFSLGNGWYAGGGSNFGMPGSFGVYNSITPNLNVGAGVGLSGGNPYGGIGLNWKF